MTRARRPADIADLTVYGATGFTGKLALQAGQRLGLQMVLAGRNQESLERVARSFDDEYPVVVARHDDVEGLARVAGAGRVLASTAGPFGEVGSLTVAAAVAAGRHYLDSTGEVDFMEQTFRRHNESAREQEIVVMNACAFEYVIGDCLTALALAGNPGAAELRVSYWLPDKAATRGTAKSALRILGSEAGSAVQTRAVELDFPPPVGRKWGVTYAGGELEFLRRRRPGLKVSTLMDMSPLVARSSRTLPALRPLLGWTPVRAMLDRAIEGLPEGPDPERRATQEWVIMVEVDPGAGKRRGAWARGVDPYGITGEVLARVAARIIRGEHRATGVVSPAEAFEPEELLGSLADLGVHWDRI